MGAEQSSIADDMPTSTLKDRSLDAVAEYIRTSAINIVVLTGAGLSTSAGIPDFRSPGTGLYANLKRLNLPYPEAVFDIDFFRDNPEPFYLLARELYPGKFTPTISHAFIALLAKKGLLRMLFTQNIDCLERAAGVPSDLIVEAHGSFATQRCIECRFEFPDGLMKEAIEIGRVPRCSENLHPDKMNKKCDGLVKPDIVFFGESLPKAFHDNLGTPKAADLMLIIGTSLTVHPFAGLPNYAEAGVPRVLFNMERVGTLGTRADDVCILGPCDDGIRKLADALGWTAELEKLWVRLGGKASVSLEDEIDQITKEVAKSTISEKGPKASSIVETSAKLESSPEESTESEPGKELVNSTSRELESSLEESKKLESFKESKDSGSYEECFTAAALPRFLVAAAAPFPEAILPESPPKTDNTSHTAGSKETPEDPPAYTEKDESLLAFPPKPKLT